MRASARENFELLLDLLRHHRSANDAGRRRAMRALRDADVQDEFARRVRERFDVDGSNLRALMGVLAEYGPELIETLTAAWAAVQERAEA